jgi:hypothetical protein
VLADQGSRLRLELEVELDDLGRARPVGPLGAADLLDVADVWKRAQANDQNGPQAVCDAFGIALGTANNKISRRASAASSRRRRTPGRPPSAPRG